MGKYENEFYVWKIGSNTDSDKPNVVVKEEMNFWKFLSKNCEMLCFTIMFCVFMICLTITSN